MTADTQAILARMEQANKRILIIGIAPLFSDWEALLRCLEARAREAPELSVTVLYESDDHLFLRSLTTDTRFSKPRISYQVLKERKERALRMLDNLSMSFERFQLNLPHTANIIMVDGKAWLAPVLDQLHDVSVYEDVGPKDQLYAAVGEHVDFVTEPHRGGIYLSRPDDEMLVMYDRQSIPRGLFPRKAFYNTDFQRAVVWLLVFNRKGELLLHRRSEDAADNWGLWDKSAGGHVDPGDLSTARTAVRELVEELILPKGEHMQYIQERSGDFIDLGVWRPGARGSELALQELGNLAKGAWSYFKLPEPISYTSRRRVREKLPDGNWGPPTEKETKFLTDVFLFVAPSGDLEAKTDLNELSKGVSLDHRQMPVGELLSWVEEKKLDGEARNTFTDDLLFILDELREVVEGFGENLRVTQL